MYGNRLYGAAQQVLVSGGLWVKGDGGERRQEIGSGSASSG